jgi:hypothetical protein
MAHAGRARLLISTSPLALLGVSESAGFCHGRTQDQGVHARVRVWSGPCLRRGRSRPAAPQQTAIHIHPHSMSAEQGF